MRHVLFAFILGLSSVCHADLYMTLNGAGTKDGSAWDNALAYSADPLSLTDAFAALKPGDTLHLGGGDYPALPHSLSGEAPADSPRRIIGVNQQDKPVRFVGTWKKENKGKGITLFSLAKGLSGFGIENIHVTQCRQPFSTTKQGTVSHGSFKSIKVEHTRDAFAIYGGDNKKSPSDRSHHLIFEDIAIKNYTKRGIRLRDGVHHVTIKNVHADMGGKDYYVEAFPMSFSIQGGAKGTTVFDHDITYINCTARNNYQFKAPEEYWNADGFVAERNVYNVTYIGCEAYDNTDGGWDDKSQNPLLVGCISIGNKKNYRFWSNKPGVVLYRCLAAYSFKRGGNSSETGLWTSANATIVKSTLWGTTLPVGFNDWKKTIEDMKAQHVSVTDSIIAKPAGESLHYSLIKLKDSIEYTHGTVAGEASGFSFTHHEQCPRTVGKAFDSAVHGESKGYHSAWNTPEALAAARALQPLHDGPK